MKQIIKELKQRVKLWLAQRKEAQELRRERALDDEARQAVQVMEYNGSLFVCVNGQPLFDIDIFKNSLAEVIAGGRKTYKEWKEEKLWEK